MEVSLPEKKRKPNIVGWWQELWYALETMLLLIVLLEIHVEMIIAQVQDRYI